MFPVPSGIVLPHPPTDEQTLLYLKSGRWLVCTVGIVSFTSLTVGMVFFVISSASYWFAIFIALFTTYLFLSYVGVSVWGKDFDNEDHTTTILSAAAAAGAAAEWVDVFLPVCGEPMCVLDNTWSHVAKLHWTNINVHVLDDGASDEVKILAESYGF
jgi:hypothetical protein